MNTFNPFSIQSFFLFFLVSLTPVTIYFVVEFIRSLVRPASPPSTKPPAPPTTPVTDEELIDMGCTCGGQWECEACKPQPALTKEEFKAMLEDVRNNPCAPFPGSRQLTTEDDHCPKFGDCQGCDYCDEDYPEEEQFIPPYSSDSAPFC